MDVRTHLKQMVCMMTPAWALKMLTPEEQKYALFEPQVLDLSKVDLRSEVRVCVCHEEAITLLFFKSEINTVILAVQNLFILIYTT